MPSFVWWRYCRDYLVHTTRIRAAILIRFNRSDRILKRLFDEKHSHTILFSDTCLHFNVFRCKIDLFEHFYLKQESPPTWSQETYRPPRSKYSLWCSLWGGGGTQSRLGVPLSCPDWGYPCAVVPPVRTGVPPPPAGTVVHPHQNRDTPWKGPGTTDLGKNLGLGYHPVNRQTPVKTLPFLSFGCGR